MPSSSRMRAWPRLFTHTCMHVPASHHRYASCPPAANEWAKRSRVLANLPADPVATVHPCVVARPRDGVGGGLGLYATNGIAKGEVVWAEPACSSSLISATPRTRAWVEALPPDSKR